MKACRDLTETIDTHPISVDSARFLTHSSKILTMGSCFAWALQRRLSTRGFQTITKQDPGEADLIWYNTFTMLAEFRRVTGEFRQEPGDYWSTQLGYQDPYRRLVFAPSPIELAEKIHAIDVRLKHAILTADAYLLTLGLVEVWFQRSNGQAICAAPRYGRGGGDDSEFKFTSYEENLDNVDAIMRIIAKINPRAKVLIAVSPVPITTTHSGLDHLIADAESKAILRAVAGVISRKYDCCHYFHCYELARALDRSKVYGPDGRHVCGEFASRVVDELERLYVKPEA